MKHHLFCRKILTLSRHPGGGQWQQVSLTGAVSSEKVTEECYGSLSLVGNQASSIWVEESLTVRHTSRTDTKVGPSDPAAHRGMPVA